MLLHKNNPAEKAFMPHSKPSHCIQPKLTINTPGDQYEQEADAMAGRVMRMPLNEPMVKPVTGLIGTSVQRKCAHCEEEEKRKKPVMRKMEANNPVLGISSSFAASLNASKGTGSTLPQGTRHFMENAFSADFSNVSIHAGSKAAEMSRGIHAKAFTTGNDIYFNEGQYNPASGEGQHLLAHELAHVLQQNTHTLRQHALQRVPDEGAATAHEPAAPAAIKTISVDFVRTAGSTISPAAELAAANTIFSACRIHFVTGAMPARESRATTRAWLGGDTDVNASGITCAATTAEESNMYSHATSAHNLTGRMRVFLVDTFSGYGAAGFSRPPYCAGGGYANHVILANVASGATNPLAHEFGHILQNNGVHSTGSNLMAPTGGTVLDATQCAACYANA